MQASESHSHTADPRQRHDLSELLRLLRRTNRFEGCVLKYPSPIPPVRLSLTELSSAHERRSGLGRVPRRAVRRCTALLDTCGWRPSFAGHDGRDTRDAGRGGPGGRSGVSIRHGSLGLRRVLAFVGYGIEREPPGPVARGLYRSDAGRDDPTCGGEAGRGHPGDPTISRPCHRLCPVRPGGQTPTMGGEYRPAVFSPVRGRPVDREPLGLCRPRLLFFTGRHPCATPACPAPASTATQGADALSQPRSLAILACRLRDGRLTDGLRMTTPPRLHIILAIQRDVLA